MSAENKFKIEKEHFGLLTNSTEADIFTLTNPAGIEARITNYGGIIVSLRVPDREGSFDDIVLGYDTLEGYLNDNYFMGALVGRYCNRIAAGKFSLNSVGHQLAQNRGGNHLHGGNIGYHQKLWTANGYVTSDAAVLELEYISPDGEENYPGELRVKVVYSLTADNALRIDYSAVSDKDTIVNLTNHSYFNLGGARSENVLDDLLYINGDRFLPVDDTLIPTGELRGVKGTPMDFLEPAAIGARIGNDDEQLKLASGYDQNWVLNKAGNELSLAARVLSPATGRVMEVHTTQPGMQFYSGNRLENMHGKNGQVHNKRSALCLETQHFPDSPNKSHFPSVVLKAGEKYNETTIYKFPADQ